MRLACVVSDRIFFGNVSPRLAGVFNFISGTPTLNFEKMDTISRCVPLTDVTDQWYCAGKCLWLSCDQFLCVCVCVCVNAYVCVHVCVREWLISCQFFYNGTICIQEWFLVNNISVKKLGKKIGISAVDLFHIFSCHVPHEMFRVPCCALVHVEVVFLAC